MASTAVARVAAAMERIAPTRLAEKWDNVGLIVAQASDAAAADAGRTRARVFLTNDLTERVLAEALAGPRPDVIVSYHPTPFRKFNRLTTGDPTQRIVLELARAGVAVYAPHTALDSVDGGINDWLAGGVGEGEIAAVSPASDEATLAISKGVGRVNRLAEPCSLEALIGRVKAHLGLEYGDVVGAQI